MEKRENLELVAVDYESNDQKAILTFLDDKAGTIHTVNWNKQGYKDGKFVADPEKAEKVEKWAQDMFGCSFAELGSCIGARKDVYLYDKFNSLFEASENKKFSADMVGEIYQTAVESIDVDDIAIRIRYKIDGDTYETKHTFAKYVESMGKWFVDPQKRQAVFRKFEDKYGVPVEQRDTLIGHPLMVEVKAAYGKFTYGDIKKFPKRG